MNRALLALFALAACAPEPTLDAPDEAPMDAAMRVLQVPDIIGGCGDISVYAATGADDRAIVLSVRGNLAEEAHAIGAPTTHDLQLPHPDVDLVLQWGTDLTVNECNDAVWTYPVVTGEGVASGGRLVLELTPDLSGAYGVDIPTDANVRLEDVVFTDAQGRSRRYSVDLGTVHVGWLPG